MEQRSVLVIDDNPDDAELCSRLLAKSGDCIYTTIKATTPEQGIQIIENAALDCVIIDFHFPSSSGLELLIRLQKLNPNLPIIVLTGLSDQSTAVKLLKEGAKDYLVKSQITTNKLHQVISNAINTQFTYKQNYKKTHVAIVDDNPDDIELCQRALNKSAGRYSYSQLSSGESLFEFFKTTQPDCVLLDYSLPGKNGMSVLTEIMDAHPFTAVIMLTGQGNETLAVEAIKNGAENYFIKSQVNPSHLDKAIQIAVEKKRLEKTLHDKEETLEQKEQALQQSEAKLRDVLDFQNLIFESMPEYLLVKNDQFQLVKVNTAFRNLYPPDMHDKIIGYTTLESYPEEEVEKFLAMDKVAFETGYSETFETITFPSGELRTIFTTKTRFTDSHGETFILGIARDVTEREQLINQLTKSNQDLDQFAYVASHDLKSPLNAILKLVGWIKEDFFTSFPTEAQDNFNLIENRANRMSALLDDLLNYSRLNRQCSEAEWFELKHLKDSILDLTDHKEQFEISLPEIKLFLPKIALQMVLVNLISNTVKHHDKAAGKITLKVTQQTAGYQLDIQDDGPGINSEYADKVFEMFQTLKPRDKVEGSGMGLAIVKKIVEHYGGHICLVEQPFGAHFQIFWPVKIPIE